MKVVKGADGDLDRLLGTVGEAMSGSVFSVDAEADCQEVALQLERQQVSGAPVTRHGRVIGVVLLSDLAARSGMARALTSGPFLRFERRLREMRVEEVMSQPPLLVRTDWPLSRAVDVMERSGVNRLPVVDAEDRPVGILARDDVIRAVARHSPDRTSTRPRPQIGPD